MAGPNPLVALGVLNRMKGSVVIPAFPQLNITAPFLTREAVRLAIEGDLAQMLPQLAGMVISQEVYLTATLLIGLVKTTPLVALYKAQMESNSTLGDVTFRSDATNIPPYTFNNCALEGFDGLDASGTNAAFPIRIKGTYYVNSNLFN